MRYRSLFIFAISLCAAVSASAGPLKGRIIDPDGRPVPGAQVLLLGQGGAARNGVTNASGEFTIAAQDTGRYQLLVALEGFRAEPVLIDATAEPRDFGDVKVTVSALTESLVVSAAQVEIPLSRASASVTIITAADIEARQIHTVADALRTVPGLTVVGAGGPGALTSVFPRGGESNYSLLFIDGIQANSFGGEFDFAHLSTANVERIEVVRGPQSALYGSNAIGSVVRIITRRGGPVRGSGALEAGSFDTRRVSAAATGSRGSWEWGASAERLTSDGRNGGVTAAGETIQNDDYVRDAMGASGGWRVASGRSLRGDVRYARDERGFPGPFGSNPVGAFAGVDDVSRGSDDRWLTSVAGVLPLGERVRTQAQISYSRVDGRFLSRPFAPGFDPSESESTSRRLGARVQADVTVSPQLDFSAGLELQRERAGSTYITGASFQPIPITRAVAGYFAEGRWSAAQRLFVTAGIRIDDIQRDALEADPNTYAPRPAFPAESVISTNPKISAAWFIRPDAGTFTKMRASAGTGIRPPDGFEIAFTDNPSLKPERSASVEAGIDQAFASGRGVIEATAFVNNYDDLIVAVGSFRGSSRYRTDNISNARARGVELAGTARGQMSRIAAHLYVAYTFLDTEVLAVDRAGGAPPPFTVGDPLLRRPRHQVSTTAQLHAGRFGMYVQGGGRGRALDVEPTLGTYGGLFDSPGYQVWNTGASWRVHRAIELFGRVENLLDRRYEEALGFPAQGRGVMAGLRIAAGR